MNQEYTHFLSLKVNAPKCYVIVQLVAIPNTPCPILLDINKGEEVQNFHLQ